MIRAMAEGGGRIDRRRKDERRKLAPRPRDSASEVPLPLDMPGSMFTGPGLLQLADLLPVMTAYIDRDEVMRFVNKPYAEWMGLPRKDILGKTMRELLGDSNYQARKALLDIAM